MAPRVKDDWQRLQFELVAFLTARFKSGVVSPQTLAAHLGVKESTLRGWLVGDGEPSAKMQAAIRDWMAERRVQLRKRASRKRA